MGAFVGSQQVKGEPIKQLMCVCVSNEVELVCVDIYIYIYIHDMQCVPEQTYVLDIGTHYTLLQHSCTLLLLLATTKERE